MLINWDAKAKKSYELLYKNNKITFAKVQKLLESIEKQYDNGIGKPERLKGYNDRIIYSRRINDKDRLIYEVIKDDNEEVTSIIILQLKGHYNDR